METPSQFEPASVAELALGRPVGAAAIERRTSVAYDPYLPGRSVERVDGVARLADGETGSWSAIVKRTEGPGLRAARRELDAYRLGIADARPVSGLRAPRLLGWHEAPETVELWLEVLADGHGGRWTSGRFGAAARHIAAADARCAIWTSRRRSIPRTPGLNDTGNPSVSTRRSPSSITSVARAMREPSRSSSAIPGSAGPRT